MVSLQTQRKLYMEKLQFMTNIRQADIDAKVAAYRKQLEDEKVTPEMAQLTEFIRQIDKMLAFNQTNAIVTDEHDTDVEETVEANEPISFHNTVESNEATVNCATSITCAEQNVKAPFKALAEDIADTRSKLRAAEQGRPGMSNIVVPNRN